MEVCEAASIGRQTLPAFLPHRLVMKVVFVDIILVFQLMVLVIALIVAILAVFDGDFASGSKVLIGTTTTTTATTTI